MNTNQLKKFAQEARRELLKQVSNRLDFVLKGDTPELREKAQQVQKLKKVLDEQGRQQLIDKVAYTWFNRLVALRFMDVNDYQPLGIRVITPQDGFTIPELLQEARQGHVPNELHGDKDRIAKLISGSIPSSDPQNEAYRLLFLAACNHLNKLFPFLFESINDWMELLLPDDLISELSVLELVRNGMTIEDCQEVEIIGWLYQFYISEKKDAVFAAKGKVKKEDIPAVTQLFTPRWIVEYMVQNTLGKLWLQNRPNSKLREHMPYFIESPSMESDDYLKVDSVEEIKLLDQACGSGHILVYAFDLFWKIYEEEGYNTSEIAKLIIEKNLYGFEIDERAAQLSSLAILMEARSKSRRLFKKEDVPEPNILQFQDLKLSSDEIKSVLAAIDVKASDALIHDLNTSTQATNLGSLIQPHSSSSELNELMNGLEQNAKTSDVFLKHQMEELKRAVSQLRTLGQKFHCVVDNPPYMGGGTMNRTLSEFVKVNYPDSKADLMACFMEAGLSALFEKGILGMINQHSWMFLSSYSALRSKIINKHSISSLLHLGPRTFPEISGEVVQSASFCLTKSGNDSKGIYFRLVDYGSSSLKLKMFAAGLEQESCAWKFSANQENFKLIEGTPICYWPTNSFFDAFHQFEPLDNVAFIDGKNVTGDNNRFFRFHWEVERHKFQDKYIPIAKGGDYRKWMGNTLHLIDWSDEAKESYKSTYSGRLIKSYLWFRKGLTFSRMAKIVNCRRIDPRGTFDGTTVSFFFREENNQLINWVQAFFNSVVGGYFVKVLNPTLVFQFIDIKKIPIGYNQRVNQQLIEQCNHISLSDWNRSEISIDFQLNPLLEFKSTSLSMALDAFISHWSQQLETLKSNEEQLNEQFIEIYGLSKDLNPIVGYNDLTILQEEATATEFEFEIEREVLIKQLISYAVGCVLGRFSLYKKGVIISDPNENVSLHYTDTNSSVELNTFLPDEDNIVPILNDEWFTDDLTGRFTEFIEKAFGKENCTDNLSLTERILNKGIRFYFLRDFYDDHIKRYKKRPIYWMFSSEKGAFNVLIYMHRYTPDTLNIILNDYLRPFIDKLKNRVSQLEHIEQTGEGKEKTRAIKEMDKLKLQIKECEEYEREVLYPLASKRIEIDLDDGVLVNYNKFGKAVKEVPGLNDKATKKKVREFDWIDTSQII